MFNKCHVNTSVSLHNYLKVLKIFTFVSHSMTLWMPNHKKVRFRDDHNQYGLPSHKTTEYVQAVCYVYQVV